MRSDGGIGAHLVRISDGLARLLGQHFALARLELADDARRVGVRVGAIALFAPFILVGHGFLCAAAAVGLAGLISYPWALVAVGAANLMLGIGGVTWAAQSLKSRKVLDDTVDELRRSADLLARRPNDKYTG